MFNYIDISYFGFIEETSLTTVIGIPKSYVYSMFNYLDISYFGFIEETSLTNISSIIDFMFGY